KHNIKPRDPKSRYFSSEHGHNPLCRGLSSSPVIMCNAHEGLVGGEEQKPSQLAAHRLRVLSLKVVRLPSATRLSALPCPALANNRTSGPSGVAAACNR